MSYIRRFSQSELVRGSLFIFIGNNLASFGNFLYNLLMGRLLGPEKYGDLVAIISLTVLLGLPLGMLNLPLVKIISSYWGKKEVELIKSLLAKLTAPLFFIGLVAAIILVLFQSTIAGFLQLDSATPILVVALSFVLSGPAILNRTALQGVLSFSYITFNSFVEVSLKIIISVLLVLLNFSLVGALLGPVIGGIGGYLLTIIELRFILGITKVRKVDLSWRKLLIAFLPIFIATSALTLFFTVDMILVRHFFPAGLAGEYAALSTTGKIIYYVVGPIITVMFPVISSRVSGGLSYILPLIGTLVVSLGLATVIITSFFLFPKLVIGILYGSKYYGVIPYLGLFSFYITIYMVNSILTHFLLSISFYRPIYLLSFVSLFQGILIFIFHETFSQVIWVNIATSLMYLFIISYFVIKREGERFIKILVKVLPSGIYGQ